MFTATPKNHQASHPFSKQVHDESGQEDQGGVAGGDAKSDKLLLAHLAGSGTHDDPDLHSNLLLSLIRPFKYKSIL
jgi:hypothetical protein